MDIAQAKTADLIPYGFNNRIHSQEQVNRIANSITQFGFNQPIVVDENNIILVGHGRYEAAKKLSLDEVPVLKKTNLSETEKRAYRILDNKLQNDSTWNAESLQIELAALEESSFEFDDFGLKDLADLFKPSEVMGHQMSNENVERQTFDTNYTVVVICKGEEDQRSVFTKLIEEGYHCKIVTS